MTSVWIDSAAKMVGTLQCVSHREHGLELMTDIQM